MLDLLRKVIGSSIIKTGNKNYYIGNIIQFYSYSCT